MAAWRLACPPSKEDILALHVGDLVYLSGEIVTSGGLPTHKRMIEALDDGTPLPLKLDGVFVHLPSMLERRPDGGYDLLYINPTTSTRFNDYMPRLISGFGLRIVGGKGGLGPESVEAMRETGCVYLSFLGGGSAILSAAVREVLQVEWRDLPSHFRLSRLLVEDLGPLTVGIDAHGRSIYDELESEARRRLPEILRRLDERRAEQAEDGR